LTNKDLLVASLSRCDIRVKYKKGNISVDKLYVELINTIELNKSIKNKLGKDYKVFETFEIHFKKDDKKVDSYEERTVTITIAKKDNAELEVYNVTNDNSLEKMSNKYSSGELQFSVNHFSKFTIVERIKIANKDLEERTKIEIPEKIENKVNNELPETKSIKDEKQLKILPKAGISANSSISAGFVLLIVASIIRKKKNYI